MLQTHAERRLADNLGTLLIVLATNVRQPEGMGREASLSRDVLRTLPWLGLAGGLGGLAATLLSSGGAALAAGTPIALRRAWDLIKRKTGIDPKAGIPLPYQDVRRVQPRSDDKWWDRDRPSEIGEVSPGFYAETPDYEPWYLQHLHEQREGYRRDVSGLPQMGQPLSSYVFKPQAPSTYPMLPNAFGAYDAETSRSPLAASNQNRTVMAQTGGFTTDPIGSFRVPGNHPFADMIAPKDAEQAASLGAYEGWYAPSSPSAPFTDSRFGRSETAVWQPAGPNSKNPFLENMMRRQQAMMPVSQAANEQAMNWRIGWILTRLKGGSMTRDEASRSIYGLIDMLRSMGIPQANAEQMIQKTLESVRAGTAGGMPTNMVGTELPSREEADWTGLHTPQGNPMRDMLMRNIDQQQERLREMTPGFGSPLHAYMATGDMAGGVM